MKPFTIACLFFAGVLCSAGRAQQKLEFEAASIRLSPADANGVTVSDRGGPESDDPGRWSCEYYSLRDLLAKAYGLYDFQVSGPKWLDGQRFHVQAKLPAGATPEEFRTMLQNLLIERFKLAAHLDQRDILRYQLSVATGGPKLTASGRPTAAEPEVTTIRGRTRLSLPGSTMADLAEELSLKMEMPVVDMTGLKGAYDVGLFWVSQRSEEADNSAPILRDALREQLGLRLDLKKGLVSFLMVDHIEKTPSDN